MKNILLAILLSFLSGTIVHCQTIASESTPNPVFKDGLKFNLNEDGSHYFKFTFLNQTWLRWNESNPGTTQFRKEMSSTFDIGLRRTRMQLFGQITDRAFIYFQFGQNNFNSTYASNPSNIGGSMIYGNRKFAAFFHDALCEYKLSKGNQLKVGGGLTVLNGLSRFSQPSVGTIMTLDVPVFLQYSVDQIDQFDRRLAVYARGQLSKLDYRFYLSNPMPISSSGTGTSLGDNATFVNTATIKNGRSPGINNQYGTYLAYNIFDQEPHTTPYMAGTYLGAKKVWNVAVGTVFQKNATWYGSSKDNLSGIYQDTLYNDMMHLSLETFLDMPCNKEKGTAINFFAGYYHMNYGKNYLRYNGIMNPATGTIALSSTLVQASAFGNAFPMFGSGQLMYAQAGYLLPRKLLGESRGQLLPYASSQYAKYNALQGKSMLVFDIGMNWLLKGHTSKISIDYQNRPTYTVDATKSMQQGPRKSCLILQYQVSL